MTTIHLMRPAPEVLEFRRHLEGVRAASAHTVRNYMADLAHFEAYLAERRLVITAVTHETIRAYLSRITDTLAASSRARRLAAIKSFYKFLHKRGTLESSPARRVKSPKLPKRLPKVIPIDEVFA
ncbi:MAG TPA: site-specific integrase, partial [Myxococcaceae bacterium]|nr:site-specific integrase [Myxococcaceae bacterium]